MNRRLEDIFESFFPGVSNKWRVHKQQFVDRTTQRPHVNFMVIPVCRQLNQFGRHEFRSPQEFIWSMQVRVDCQPKITQFYRPILHDYYVFRLDIEVYYAFIVDIL